MGRKEQTTNWKKISDGIPDENIIYFAEEILDDSFIYDIGLSFHDNKVGAWHTTLIEIESKTSLTQETIIEKCLRNDIFCFNAYRCELGIFNNWIDARKSLFKAMQIEK